MNKRITFLFLLIVIGLTGISQVYYHQDFEEDSLPNGIPTEWNEYAEGTFDWDTLNGGHDLNPGIPGDSNPPYAYEGSKNAYFFAQSVGNPSTYMVLPHINLKFAIKPELSFYHAQDQWITNNDNLEISYKTGEDSSWVSLEEYTDKTDDDQWEQRIINLPKGCLVDTCILGFKATSNVGHGVCIDDIWIVEKGVVNKFIGSIGYEQIATNFVATETEENPILRLDFEVYGNSSTAILDSIAVKSLNTDDDDILTNGVKIFRTREAIFDTETQLGTSQSFSGGYAVFDNINYDFPSGYNYLWITYDIDSDPTHQIHNNIADAMIEAENIFANDTLYPSSDQSPSGSASIYESIFYDDFENSTGWTLNPALEFEIDTPKGRGTTIDGLVGNPDPSSAFQGGKVLGTDLNGGSDPFPGGYNSALVDREYYAITPTINCNYYRDLKLSFQRWLNVENRDSALIDISTDNGSSWKNIWQNPYYVRDNKWGLQEIDIADFDTFKTEVKIQFAVGPTDAGNQYSGWNIDNLALTGNYISADVKIKNILAPSDGCGHTNADSITVVVENMGGQPTNDTIPLVFSPDGIEMIRDTLFGSIGVGEDTTYTFTPTVDFSIQGLYDEVFAASRLADDEYVDNDTLYGSVIVPPIFIPPYFENFESGYLHWIPDGTNSSWQFGEPSGTIINTAASPDSAWVTNLGGVYNQDEDSYLESPCFNFTDMDFTIFEMKLWCDAEENVDGGALEYSIDNGSSWNIVERLMYQDFNWLWYTNTTGISALGTNGWDTISAGYLTVSTFLPVALQDQSSVKLRITFASDNSIVSNDGIAVDDIKIYNAPVNTGVTAIDYPTNPICETTSSELITVSVKNFGLDTLEIGDSIFLGYEFDSGLPVIDTIILTEIIKPDSIKPISCITPIDLSMPGIYNLKVYTIDEFPNFYSQTSDTITDDIEVKDNPIFDIGPDLYTVRPDTVTLNAYTGSSGYSYFWQDLSTDSVLHVASPGNFYVTVTDDATSCFTIDSTHIYQLIADIGIDSLYAPTSACELEDNVYIQTRIYNYGTDTLQVNDTVRIAYEINGMPERIDTFLLPSIIYPDSMYTFTSQDTFDMSVPQAYNLKLYSILTDDNDANNDTINKIVDVYGYPDFAFEPNDTIVRAMQYTIDAGAGFDTYLWQDASSNQTYDVTSNGWYYVTVTDANNCSANDSINITLIIQDISVTDMISPTTKCNLEDEPVEIVISNLGTDTIFNNDTIIIGYLLDDTPTGRDSIFLTEDFLPTNTINHTFSDQADMSIVMDHEIKSYVIGRGELIPSNDTLISNVENKDEDLPIELGPETLATTLPYLLDPGEVIGYSYLWQDNSTNPTYLVQDYGIYSVTVTGSDNCTGVDSITVEEINAIIEINNEEAELDIYPNPASEVLHFELNTSQEIDLILELIDMNGKIVYSNNLNGHGKLNDDIPVVNYPPGIYIIKLIIDDHIYTDQIIIQ